MGWIMMGLGGIFLRFIRWWNSYQGNPVRILTVGCLTKKKERINLRIKISR